MKTNNLFKTLLMAVMLAMGCVNAYASDWSITFDGMTTTDKTAVNISETVVRIGNTDFGTASWGDSGATTTIPLFTGETNQSFTIDRSYFADVTTSSKLVIECKDFGQYYWSLSAVGQGWPNDPQYTNSETYLTNSNSTAKERFEFEFSETSVDVLSLQGLKVNIGDLTVTSVSLVSSGAHDIDPKFVLQTGTSWLLRAGNGLYSSNSGNCSFGIRDCKAGQVITIDASLNPEPQENVVLKSQNGNIYKYVVQADGNVRFNPGRYIYIHSITIDPGYKVTYKIGDEVYKTVWYEAGETVEAEADLHREGYTFGGWSGYPENMVMPAYDVTVNGSLGVNHYSIVYNVDGGYFDGKYNIPYGTTIAPDYLPSNTPTKTGYLFDHWDNLPTTVPDHDLVVEAVFVVDPNYDAPKYKLIYSIDFQPYVTLELAAGTTVTPMEKPTKDGYTFYGWNNEPQTMPAQNWTVSGYYQINTYKMYYVIDGVTYKTVDYQYNATVYPEQEPSKENYLFTGWSEIPATMPAHDVTITGSYISLIAEMWKPTAETSTAAGTVIVDNSLLTASTVYETTLTQSAKTIGNANFTHFINVRVESAPTAEAPTGTEKSGSTPIVISPKKNVEVVFYFRRQSDNKNGVYTSNAGKDLKIVNQAAPQTALEGVEEVFENTDEYGFVTKKLYLKAGETYTVYATGTTINFYGFSYVVAAAVKFTLSYVVDGQTYQSLQLEEGAAIPQIDDPVKTGYTFTGWDRQVTTMPGSDLTLTGGFTINTYTLSFEIDGVAYGQSQQLEYGAPITAPADPTRDGSVFSGWQNLPATMPAYNLTVYGYFEQNKSYETVSVGATGYNTYCSTRPLLFKGSESVKAFIATAKSATEVTLTQIIGSVAAGTGLVLIGTDANVSAIIEVAGTGVSYSNNLLVGVTGQAYTANAANQYVLVNKDGVIKFADTAAQPATIPVGKAYLQAAAGSRTLTITFDSETTGIETVRSMAKTGADDAQVYNLRGQRVVSPKKGLYLVNGKKVIIK